MRIRIVAIAVALALVGSLKADDKKVGEILDKAITAHGGADELKKLAIASFGSWDAYVADVKGSAGSTPGWVLTTKSRIDGHLHNYIMYEHHIGMPAHQDILMALDCWEHAFFIDYGVKKADYLTAFFKNANWVAVNARLSALVAPTK